MCPVNNFSKISKQARVLICLILTACGLAACSSAAAPPTQYFLLATPGSEELRAAGQANIDIERVALPAYLNQLGIVILSDSRQVNVARFNLWAEPLGQGISRLLARKFTPDDTQPVLRLELGINFFHGDETGQVILDANWRLRGRCDETSQGQFRQSVRQESAGYAALVDAHDQLLGQMANTIMKAAEALGAAATGGCQGEA